MDFQEIEQKGVKLDWCGSGYVACCELGNKMLAISWVAEELSASEEASASWR
jgi:hypothetical protein